MSPTRRDVIKRSAAAVAVVSIATLPIFPVAAKPHGLASMVDTTSAFVGNLHALDVMLNFHWRDWTPARRARFVEVLDDALGREYHDLLADTIALIERSEERRVA